MCYIGFNKNKIYGSEIMTTQSIYKFLIPGFAIVAVLLILANQPVSASVFLTNGTDVSQDRIPSIINTTVAGLIKNPVPLVFFYDRECQSCEQALESVRFFEKRNPNVRITYYSLGDSQKNRSLFTEYKGRFNTTKIRYPAIFADDLAISGSSDIIHNIESFARGYVK